MIDDLVVEMQITPPQEVVCEIHGTFEYCGMIFQPKFRMGRVTKYYGELKNLMIEIVYDRMFIKNSWHKYYHGNNYGDYTYGEIKETIQQLKEKFGPDFLNAKIIKMAVGCNLPMDAGDIFPKCVALGPDIFQDMKFGNKHKTYGKYIKKTHSKFKIYDKQWEIKEHDRHKIHPAIRIELEMNMKSVQKRVVLPNQIFIIHDLLDLEKFCFVIHEILLLIPKIAFDSDLPIEKVENFKDVEIIVFMQNPKLRQQVKKKANPKTFRQWSNRYEELKISHAAIDYNTMLLNLVEDKMVQLIRCEFKS